MSEDTKTTTVEAKGQRTLTGRVVSSKMQKTVAVEIERLVKHDMYGKFIRRTTKLLAHDESGESKEGDLVTIVPCFVRTTTASYTSPFFTLPRGMASLTLTLMTSPTVA